MKKSICLILSLIMILSLTSVSALAANTVSLDSVEHVVELYPENSPISTDDADFTMLNSPNLLTEELDFSNAVRVTPDLIDDASGKIQLPTDSNQFIDNIVDPLDLPENQNPVGVPELLILNPESMRDGRFTTDSIFFLALRWNNTDLCYDPEGGPLTLVYNTSFPAGYIAQAMDEVYGTYAGYVINISSRGTYPFAYAMMDMYGGATEIGSFTFDIISRGIFESVDGSLDSQTEIDEYQITVDFSVSDSYEFAAMRTGTGGFKIEAYDASETVCGWLSTSSPSYATIHKDSFTLTKPDGVTGEYTYTIKVSTSSNSFVEGNTSYRFAYGTEDQKFYFFEDVADAVTLPRFTPARNLNQVRNAYVNNANPSDFGDYYLITATGPETVTLTGAGGLYRFRVLDATTLEPLYNGEDLIPYIPIEGYSNVISVTIGFTAGQSYYIVVYNEDIVDTPANYAISVGDRELLSDYRAIPLSQANFVAGVPHTFIIEGFETPNGLPGYVDHIRLSTTMSGFHLSDSKYSVLTPGASSWVNNMQHNVEIDFGFDNNLPLVNAVGDWQLRMIPSETGVFPASTLYIYYHFQI